MVPGGTLSAPSLMLCRRGQAVQSMKRAKGLRVELPGLGSSVAGQLAAVRGPRTSGTTVASAVAGLLALAQLVYQGLCFDETGLLRPPGCFATATEAQGTVSSTEGLVATKPDQNVRSELYYNFIALSVGTGPPSGTSHGTVETLRGRQLYATP